MLQTCTRCSAPASAVMSFYYDGQGIWLDDIHGEIEPGTGYAMCVRHSDRMTPPLGWSLTDRRQTTRLFAPLEVA